MNKYVKKPYFAFDPEQAEFLFDRHFKLDSKEAILSKIPKMVNHLYLPKKRLIGLGSLILAFVLIFIVAVVLKSTNKLFLQVLVVIFFMIIGMFLSLLSHYFAVFFEIIRLKKLYKSISWPCQAYCAFYAEGFYYKAADMVGVFYWHDLMNIMVTPEVLSFDFCPSGTSKGNMFKKFYPKLKTFYMFINGDEQVLELMKLVDQEIDELIEFR